jgi:uncharacterized lipoprotein YmbA
MRRNWPAMLFALLIVGCGSSPPAQFYTLTSVPATSRVAVFGKALPLTVGRVELPGDLEREAVVTRIGANRLNVSDQDRWGGPFDEMIQRVLASDLGSRLPSGMVLAPGDPVPPSGVRTVRVNVRQFIGDAAGHVVLDVDWSLLAGKQPVPVLIRHETLTADAGSSRATAIVAAMSRLLGELSDRIATAITST